MKGTINSSFRLFFSLVIIITMTLFSCSVSQKTTQSVPESPEIAFEVEGCNAIATVKNYTHENACQYLLRLEDGTLLLPGSMNVTNVPFYEGAGVKIGYQVLDKDDSVVAKSECTKHDYIVKITCMEEYVIPEPGMPETHTDCIPLNNPYKFSWMREAIAALNPSKINEYEYSIGFIYEFTVTGGSILYDCLGNKMCATVESTDCASLLETLSKPKVLLVVNN